MEPCTVTREADWHRTITRDVATGATELVMVKDSGGVRYDDIDWRLDCAGTERYRIRPDDPLSAEADCVYHHELSRGDWVARSVTRTTLKGDATHFHFTGDGGRLFQRRANLLRPGCVLHPAGLHVAAGNYFSGTAIGGSASPKCASRAGTICCIDELTATSRLSRSTWPRHT